MLYNEDADDGIQLGLPIEEIDLETYDDDDEYQRYKQLLRTGNWELESKLPDEFEDNLAMRRMYQDYWCEYRKPVPSLPVVINGRLLSFSTVLTRAWKE
ncbi:unnamed protein product [Peronospora belbahrii]|uniref:Uncharacterized protein n=1 Tax=Peronospora belbahrii TaxID=622444 RepID=A0AAU9KKV0_9STRA|nr:unnamed protein product [Peronospora belbahrii]